MASAYADDETPVGASGPPTPAVVETPTPPPPKPPSMTLDQGAVFVQVNVEMNMSAADAMGNSKVLKPFSIAPDISYGATSDLTLSLIHSTAAFTGFRGGSGFGLCVSGTDGGCPKVYRDVGVEGFYSLLRGPFAVAANAGLLSEFVTIPMVGDKTYFQAKLGFKARYTLGNVFVQFNPSVWVALNDTDTNANQVWAPVSVWAKLLPPLSVFVASGIKSPLKGGAMGTSGFTDLYTINVGGGVQYTITPHIAAGSSFIFGTMFGAPATTGTDGRAVHFWLNYSM